MKYCRLVEKGHENNPMGFGKAGARWNLRGTPMIYASNFSSISFMELLCIKGPLVATTSWILISLEISVDIPHLDPSDLPPDWNYRPYPPSTQKFGTNWAQSMTTPFLKVPSCRIPISSYLNEHNLLINPLHPYMTKLIRIISIEDVSFELNKW
jgi:RES domain-containing protein